MSKRNLIIYWISTILLSVFMLMSAGMYFFNYEEIVLGFEELGFSGRLVYPLAIAKILAVIAILTRKSEFLKEWAYAGLFFVFFLAGSSHIAIKDSDFAPVITAIVLLFTSYIFERKISK